MFRWGVSEELVSASVVHALACVKGLQEGRSAARESEPVRPVPSGDVKKTLPFLPPHARGLVEFLRYTGARPGEAVRLTLAQIDRSGPTWLYRPARHKNRHRGQGRVVAIGPRARAVVLDFIHVECPRCGRRGRPSRMGMRDNLCGDCARTAERAGTCGPWQRIEAQEADVPLFSPRLQRREIDSDRRAGRKTPVQPSQLNRAKNNPKVRPGATYDTNSLGTAIKRAAKAAKVPAWHANQLRHTFATETRKELGLEAVQAALGHARADVTQVYAERDERLAILAAERLG